MTGIQCNLISINFYQMKKYLLALSTFSGTIIGVGLFGLPFVTAKIGFIPMIFYFAVMTIAMITIQLLYGEICLRTSSLHRLPGYTELYLGKRFKWLPIITNSVGLIGANLAYIIIGGGFLADLLIPYFGGNELAYTMVFFASGAFIIFLGSKSIARSELFSLLLFFGILIFLIVESWPHIQLPNLLTVDLNFKNLILPYGVILFSLSGLSVIPETKEILENQTKWLKNLITVGLLIPTATYLLFIFVVLGISGSQTTPDGLDGLGLALGEKIIAIGYIFGIITTFTSYLTIGVTIKKILWFDLKFNHFHSWILAVVMPILLYLAGLKNFIAIVGFTGAVTLGIDVITIAFIYLKAKTKGNRQPEYNLNIPKMAIYLLVAIFLFGVILNIFPF